MTPPNAPARPRTEPPTAASATPTANQGPAATKNGRRSAAPARPLIIAIDGPAAAGKGTLARALAAALDLPYLDTGLLYRATTARLLDDPTANPTDPAAATAAAASLSPADLARPDLRTPAIDRLASSIASIPEVRAALLAWQRGFAHAHGAVLDGRDIGTVIFPDAHTKFFVTASLEARAQRRTREHRARGAEISLATVRADLAARDAADLARAAAPLRPASDAITLDTTTLDAEAVFAAALRAIRARS